MPALTPQQREDLMGPGSTHEPITADTPMPLATTSTPHKPRAAIPNQLATTTRYNSCSGYRGFVSTNPRHQVLNDTFQWGTYPRVKVGNGSGDINWLSNPYRHVSWYMWLHSLRWIGSALDAAQKGDIQALNHAKAIARDWVRDNPYSWQRNVAAWESTMHRTNMLLCLRTVIINRQAADGNGAPTGILPPQDRWLDNALIQHLEYLRHHFSGYGNHGTDESLAMLGVATTLGRRDYAQLAQTRLTAILAQAIDAEGATNEQSTGYAFFNYVLWGRVETTVSQVLPGSALHKAVRHKRQRLVAFLAHSFAPDGTPFQIGNTEWTTRAPYPGTVQEWAATRGQHGTPPTQRVAVYAAAGYVFGRSTWGSNPAQFAAASAYALRFGPPRARHGHSDHTAITWYASGAPVLIDPGFGEYTKDAWDAYAKSPQAHNQLVIGGMKDSVHTKLTRRVVSPTPAAAKGAASATSTAGTVGAGGAGGATTPDSPPARISDYYRLVDSPGKGYSRVRDVIVVSDPDVVLVVDRATAPKKTTFNQLWHLPAGTTASASRVAGHAVLPGQTQGATILSLPYARQPVPRYAMRVISGSTRPVQGWSWPNIFTKHRAPVISVNRTGRSAGLVTAIIAGPKGARVSGTAVTSRSGRSTIYTITVGGKRVQIGQSPGGSLYRVR